MAKCEHDINNYEHLCLLTGGPCEHVGRINDCKRRKTPEEVEKEEKKEKKRPRA